MAGSGRSFSLRRYLLAWIIAPIALFVVFDTVSLYRGALASLTTAYDRSLLSSARSIGDLLTVSNGSLRVDLPSAALEILDNEDTRMTYRISGFNGEFVSGTSDLPLYTGTLPKRSPYAALVDFYDAQYRGDPVRMAALYQPVASAEGSGIALIQVAETMEVRQRLARQMLVDTLLRQALLIVVVVAVTGWVVTRALRPVESLRQQLNARDDRDLSPIESGGLPEEVRPVLAAANDLMARLKRLVEHQRQFVRDASHQLRTPLAVLKTQAQNGLSGHADPLATLTQMHGTLDRAIRLANQMLALAKVEQEHGEDEPTAIDLCEVASEVALDLSPLIGQKAIDFELRADTPVWATGHAWMLRELTRNLLHNAIRATPAGSALSLTVDIESGRARLLVRDSGPGMTAAQREHLFEPFHTSHPTTGSGLGLAICRDVCERLHGRIELVNRFEGDRVVGLDAVVDLPRVVVAPGFTHLYDAAKTA